MTTIILYGDKNDTQISELMLKILEKYYNIFYLYNDNVTFLDNKMSQTINIIETQYLKNIICENAIIILKNKININKIKNISDTAKVIINSENIKNIVSLSNKLKYVYTCGYSSKDYITFSSIEENKAIVSLQRAIKNINSNICEPLDISVNLGVKVSDYSILSVNLLLIILDILNENNTEVFLT